MIHYNTHLGLIDLNETVRKAVAAIRPHLSDFDSIVTEGISGLVVAAPVAVAVNKPLVVVRKETRNLCKHACEVEGFRDAGRRTLFIDDHVDLGRTLSHVRDQLKTYASACRITGAYTYQDEQLALV